MKPVDRISPSWLWIIPLLALWFCLFLGNRPFASPDEGRYVEIPREMVASGDYVTPRLNGVKYFEKPPLFYWLQATSIKVFGIQEWAMRLWCVFFGILGCLGTYLFGRRFYGHSAGMAACLILAASPLYYALSRLIILDMPMATLVSLSLFSFLVAIHTPPGFQRRLWAWAFYGCSALAVLTKGLMALAISGPVILIWAFGTGRWKDLWPAYIPSGALLFFMIAAPWHILASLKNPEFAYKYFVVEHVLRYTTSLHMRTQPLLFFVPVLLLGLFPWTSLLGSAIRNGVRSDFTNKQRGVTLFLLIWASWTFGFFSISNSKLVPYILPCFPPLALILGAYWVKIHQPEYAASARQSLLIFIGMSVILSIGGLTTLWMMPHLIDHRPHLWADFTALSGAFLFLAGVAALFLRQRRLRSALATIPLAAVVLVVSVIRLMPELQRPSIKPLAQIIQAHKKPDDIVGSYNAYYQDLPVYVDQVITVTDAKGELEFGCEAEDCTQWMIDEKKFLQLWRGTKRLFIIARATEIAALTQREPTFYYVPLGINQGNILVTNK
ncbi:MAG: glycosyl transferase [Alphaproteobacteria bacterium]|jgi:4-amino-4-deoxy-L-arabinose transferase-like glycosyltransferase|nr:glycosyl transferase [Alphaproteobacteria bacterium]